MNIFIGRHLEQLSLIVIDLTEVYLLLIYILSLLVVVATLSFHGKLYTNCQSKLVCVCYASHVYMPFRLLCKWLSAAKLLIVIPVLAALGKNHSHDKCDVKMSREDGKFHVIWCDTKTRFMFPICYSSK